MSTTERLQFDAIDAWEALRRAVLDRSPVAARMLADRQTLDWRTSLPRDRGAVAVGCAIDSDISSPAARRHARGILSDIEAAGLIDGEPSFVVSEEPRIAYQDIPQDRRVAMGKDLQWILSPTFISELSKAAGPVAAHQLMDRKTSTLKGQRGARFLTLIGYPMVSPDKAKRRWLHRYGLLESTKDTQKNRLETVRILADFAEHAGAPLQEMDLLLAIFTGTELTDEPTIARCAVEPQCRECFLRKKCEYGRFQEQHGQLDQASRDTRRNLAEAYLPEDRPREKLAARGAESLTNAELLAIILRVGSGKEHAVEMANRILRDAGSLERLSRQSIAEMTRIPGLGPVKAITIKAALELARRIASAGSDAGDVIISSARGVFERHRGYFLDKQREEFLVIHLNVKNKITREIFISEGSLNQSVVHPREAFQDAIRDSAYAVVFVHNHPSGDPAPSRDDKLITERLVRAGEIVGIKVLDHIIIGRDKFYSFSEDGQLKKDM
ncbi:hypothetical protein BH09SUM1_BH09SUM1_14220 [soil metagenome]